MMTRRLLFCSVVLATPGVLQAQQGSLTGSVRTSAGTPVPQLVLLLEGPAGTTTLVTGPDGRFAASGLAPGQYALKLDAPGFVLAPEARTTIGTGEERLDLTLDPTPVREQVVVSATRGDAALSSLGVSVTVLDRERIASREAPSFLHLLEEVPGVAVARTGGIGPQSSAFLRGGESHFARILVDGVPVNEPGGDYNFGSMLPLELERVEVVRGAESSLYGTDALAGVIALVTHRAAPGEEPSLHAEAEGGGFDWRRFAGGTSGRRGGIDWNLGALRLTTNNQQPNSAFRETAGAATIGIEAGPRTSADLVARFESSTAGTPGQTAFGRPDLDASYERNDLVFGAHLHHGSGAFSQDVRAGWARSRQLSLDPENSGPFTARWGDTVGITFDDMSSPTGFRNDTARLSLGYAAEVQAARGHLVTAGADLERETGTISAEPSLIDAQRTNVGAYLQDRVLLGREVFVTLGGRVEHNDSFGTRVVPRAAVAWRVRPGPDATTLKASAGIGIKEPSFFESFGVSFYAKGNPDLRPERSRTVDVGVEQRLLGSRLRGELTFFHHDYRDQIAYQLVDPTTFQGTYVNLGRTRGRGAEVTLEAAPEAHLRLSATYTYLDGRILVSSSGFDPVYAAGQPLLRRPKHQGAFSASFERGRLGVGTTLIVVGRRADSDFVGLNLTSNPGYARLDARAHARLASGIEAFVAGENLLDRTYQEALGYPALGRSLRAGIRLRTGAAAQP
jgi:outer membrane cobalamin receptor